MNAELTRSQAEDSILNSCCAERQRIAAYLDGELDLTACRSFEQHIKECAPCRRGVVEQRQLLCLLNVALGEAHNLKLPGNFARIVTAHAQGDMRGVRRGAERRRAILLCCVLTTVIFGLLGAGLFDALLAPISIPLRRLFSVIATFGRAAFDASAGLTVILRFVGARFVGEPHSLGLLLWTCFSLVLALLIILINNYRAASPSAESVEPSMSN